MSDKDAETDAALEQLDQPARLARLRERLTRPFQGALESLCQKYSLNLFQVTSSLPESNCKHFPGTDMVSILESLSEWGEVLLLINNQDGVFECKGSIPKGTIGRGYYNLGEGSPISGHLRYEACKDILCVRRSFHKKETCSIQFFNLKGAAMFKIFLGRDQSGAIRPEQLDHFEALCGLTSEL